MEEQLNYQPVSFQGIVPQLDVGDPSQSFVNSMQNIISGEEANLSQMQRNAEIESRNLNVKLKGLESLSQFSEKAFETYTKISNENLKNRLAEIFVENKNNPNLDYSEFEADEKEAVDTETDMSLGVTKALRSKSNLTATDSANAAKLRNYTSLEAIVAHNGRVAGAMESYGPALEKWVNNPQFRNIKPGAEYEQVVDEFNRIWADKTGLSGANQQFLAKYVYPEIRKKEAQQRELFTRQFNVKHASEQDQVILQKLKSGLINLKKAAEMSNGLTKSDGKTLRTPDDFWNLIAKGEFTTDELTNLGSAIFEVTGKPYANHPRFQALLRDARNRRIKDYNIRQGEQKIELEEMIEAASAREPGGVLSRKKLEELRREAYGKFDNGIVDGVINGYLRQSAEKQAEIDADMRFQAWLNANPGKKLPLSVVGDAPFNIRQKYASQIEADANAETAEELLRKDDRFKEIKKEIEEDIATVGKGAFEIGNTMLGTRNPRNFERFKSDVLTDIVNRARIIMFNKGLSPKEALDTAKDNWWEEFGKQSADDIYDRRTGAMKGFERHVGREQAARMTIQNLQRTQLDNLAEGLYESDYTQPPAQGRYSKRVRFLARRYGMRPKEIVDLARLQQGLGALPSTGADDALGMVSKGEMARIASLDSSSVTAALRAQINSGQRLTGDAKSRTIAVGQQLQAMGITGIWQHPDFNYNSGYTGSGKERVGERAGNSYHKYDEALDIGLNGNGKRKLDMLYAYLMKNKERFGIAELIWDPYDERKDGHDTHIHVSFK